MQLSRRRPLAVVVLCGAGAAIAAAAPMARHAQADPAASPVSHIRQGVDLAGMDRSVRPGDDFFAYANGTWVKTTEIPADKASWGENGELAELTDKRVAELIASAGKAKGAEARKIADYYASYMDEAGIEAKGLAPLKPYLAQVDAIRSRQDLARYIGSTLRVDMDVLNATALHTDNLFGVWIAADLNAPTRYAPFLLQGGLSLPNREFYIQDNPRMAAIRDAFRAHVAKVLTLAGWRTRRPRPAGSWRSRPPSPRRTGR